MVFASERRINCFTREVATVDRVEFVPCKSHTPNHSVVFGHYDDGRCFTWSLNDMYLNGLENSPGFQQVHNVTVCGIGD